MVVFKDDVASDFATLPAGWQNDPRIALNVRLIEGSDSGQMVLMIAGVPAGQYLFDETFPDKLMIMLGKTFIPIPDPRFVGTSYGN